MGSGALAINGGTIAASANRNITARYSSVTIGGDFTLGAVTTGVASGNGTAIANITFADAMSLGSATRKITIGANGTYNLNGILSGTSGSGLTVDRTSGATGILSLGAANTYTGNTTITAGNLTLASAGTIANSPLIFIASGATLDITAKTSGFTIGSSQTIGGGGTVAAAATGGLVVAGRLGTAGISTLTLTGAGGSTFSNDSIFSWDVNAAGSGYDKLITPTLADGGVAGGSTFQIVSSDGFVNAFWNSNRSFTDIVSTDGSAAVSNWANAFTTVTVVDSLFAPLDVSARGSFSLTGSTLTWAAVPEPSSALAGLLLGVGLLRRRRGR